MSTFHPGFGQSLPLAPENTGEGKVTQTKTWRLVDIQNMSAEVYRQNLATIPDFQKAVDALFAAPPAEIKTETT